ncbi:Nucleosomal histone H3-Lys79 methylase [Physocladia obscura]|uniref:Histone-lysine N-methyltransferase, H3 lysine-79 specific n=1 Tax=Physocladia obscura TaxID=109957 RepID=A0AAD5XE88_9FUNG|nr:Nucleosomal histone H3-Lys79 methylase [Physocladia obscura]
MIEHTRKRFAGADGAAPMPTPTPTPIVNASVNSTNTANVNNANLPRQPSRCIYLSAAFAKQSSAPKLAIQNLNGNQGQSANTNKLHSKALKRPQPNSHAQPHSYSNYLSHPSALASPSPSVSDSPGDSFQLQRQQQQQQQALFSFAHARDSVLLDPKIYRPLSTSLAAQKSSSSAPSSVSPSQKDFEFVPLEYPSPVTYSEQVHQPVASTERTTAGAPAKTANNRISDDNMMITLTSSSAEFFPLCEPTRSDEYNPLHDLKHTVAIIVAHCLSPQEAEPFGDEVSGPLRAVIRACNRKDPIAIKSALAHFNVLVRTVKLNRCRVNSENNAYSLTKPYHPDLICHILDQTYAHTVAPRVDLLKSYKGFSNNVYGEVRHSLVTEFIHRTNLSSHHTFLDMGSGTGNVVLQVAAQTLCAAYGVEIMENPSTLANVQHSDFVARCRAYGCPVGPIDVWRADFLDDEKVHDVLKRADVVFVNNYAFDAHLNFRILERFLDLKEGCIVISLKTFGTSMGENALENMFRTKEYYFGENKTMMKNNNKDWENRMMDLMPAYQSFKAIESPEKEDNIQWLTYWTVFGFLNVIEVFSDTLLYWVPFYYAFKAIFVIYLIAPQFNGAKTIYTKVLQPYLLKEQSVIDGDISKNLAKNLLTDQEQGICYRQ